LAFLACGFFVIGWMDFLHAASYAGMPDFLSHNDSAKHLYFWLSSRFVAAITLLLVTLRSWQRLMTVFTTYLIFSALLLLTAIVNLLVTYYQVWLPHLFISPSRSWTTCTRAGYACPVMTLGRVFLVELSQEVQDL